MMAGGPRIPEPRPMTPEDLTRIRWVGDPQLLPGRAPGGLRGDHPLHRRRAYLSNIWVVETEPERGAPAIHHRA